MNGTRTLAAALAAAMAAGALAFAASPRERSFSSGVHGISAEAPPGWTLSTHTGYPSLLVLFLHPDGCRISLAAAATDALDLRSLVEQNRKGLEAQKLE